jgi:hypothetical protein
MSVEMRERRGAVSRVLPVAVGVAALIAALVIVWPRPNAGPAAGTPLIKVSSVNFRYRGFPKVVRPGLFQVAFTNQEGFPFRHEMVVVSLQPGQSAQTLAADARANGADSEDHYLHFGEIPDVDTGATIVGSFDLPPGTYALACWQTGQPGGGVGEVHAARGMVYPFTVRGSAGSSGG